MKRYAWLLVLIGVCLAASAAVVIQWYHEQPHATAINDGDFLALENAVPSTYKHVLLSELRGYMSGTNSNPNSTGYYVTNYVYVLVATNLYTTNAQIFFITNAVEYTQTTYSTNNILNNITNNLFVTTTEYVTNSFTVFQTNIFTETTTLYATNTLIYNITNNVLVTSNLFATNTYVDFFTNNYAFVTNLYATNSYINFLTNNYLFTTNLFVTNACVQNFTNNYAVITNVTASSIWTTNLWATNSWLEFATNQYLYTTNLYVEHINGVKGYIVLASPFSCDGAGCILYTNDNTKTYFGQGQFNNSADQAANYCTYYITVPEDFDNTVDWVVARFKFQLGGADTGTHRYVMSMSSVADSAAYAGSLGNAVNVDFAGDAAGANGDVETVSAVTLTAWKSNMTAGQLLVIRVARDGNDAADTSTVDSYGGPIVLSYGVKQ